MARAAAVSDQGTTRPTNQDACCLKVANTRRGALTMAAVCDGIGGLAHGEDASSYVAREAARWFERDLLPLVLSTPEGGSLIGLDEAWDECLSRMHAYVAAWGTRNEVQLGTTFTGIVAHRGRFLAVQVGDSRLYHLHGQAFDPVTQDQTVAAHLVETGMLGADEVAMHPGRHVILQAIGVGEDVHPTFTKGTYGPDDLFVLCTDGVHGHVGDKSLHECFSLKGGYDGPALEAACRSVVALAKESGGTDNLTVVCFCGDPVHGVEPETVVVGGDRSW